MGIQKTRSSRIRSKPVTYCCVSGCNINSKSNPNSIRSKPVTYCCVSGCNINSKSNPNTVFHLLDSLHNVSNYNLCKEFKICNNHYFSNGIIVVNQESCVSNSSVVHTPDLLQKIPIQKEICCFCSQTSKFTINNDYINGISIKDLLQKFNFVNDPSFSQRICETCVYELWISYNFAKKLESFECRQQTIESDKKLIVVLQKLTSNDILKIKQDLKQIKSKKTNKKGSETIEHDKKLIVGLQKLTSNDILKNEQDIKQIKSEKTNKKGSETIEHDKKLIVGLQKLTSYDILKNEQDIKQINSEKTDKNKTENNDLNNSIDDLKLKLEAVLKRDNPFLCKVEVNEVIKIKQTHPSFNKQRRRPIKLRNLKQKNRVLSLMASEIKDIFDSAIKNREIAENVLPATPNIRENAFTLETLAYPCQSCNKVFLSNEILDLHFCDAEVEQRFSLGGTAKKCNKCCQEFDNFQLLVKHKCNENHTELAHHTFNSRQRLFFCTHCDKSYLSQGRLNRHIRNKHITTVNLLPVNKTRKCKKTALF